ncbi:MAG: tRNA (N6-isopentenyl adenosine(37)-C2)-methylthiotransferase MiaB [Proteobacteria bacterium]|nr:tRNA (N6-isopentenyl adenosine(37)-C2)-methylthiotransferase MiaB [Pseudomonadota bacterium]
MSKKLHIKTYGCQMNVYDSDRMQDLMLACGYQLTDTPEGADMVIINTCHIREKASEKLFSDLGRLRPFKQQKQQQGSEMIVAVAGCVAQAEGEEIFKRSQVVDIVVGPESYQTLPDLVGKVQREKKKQLNLNFSPNQKFDSLTLLSQKTGQTSAFISVQEGCDKFCTFCVVPYTRGAEYSRSVNQVLDEVKKLVDGGSQEIYLLGQNVNAYHGLNPDGSSCSLASLIDKIAQIDAVKRIRYTTSHPKDMLDDLIEAHGNIAKLMPFLHLPVQSGSNAVLKMMNRKHTRQDYFKIIEKIKKSCPKIGLSSDFIVGFPGETEEDFLQTIDLVKQVKFTQCYSFKYSKRPGTPASELLNQIPEETKEERLQILQTLLNEQQLEFNQQFQDKTVNVLFEKTAPKSQKQQPNTQIWGKSEWLQSVVVELENQQPPESYFNKILPVKIVKSRPSSLIGKLL